MNVRMLPLPLVVVGSLGFAWAQQDTVPSVVQLRSYDPAANQPLEPLQDGDRVVVAADDGFAFSAETSDESVGSVRFLIDGAEVLVDSEPPFVVTFRPHPDGGWVVAGEPAVLRTVEVRVDRGAGDAEEFLAASSGAAERYPAGYTYVRSSDLEFGRDPANAAQAIGLWFPDVPIPAGASVASAELVLVARGGGEGDLAVTIRGQAAAAPEPFEEDPDGMGSRGLTERPATEASVTWDVAEADGWSAGDPYHSPDIATIVQELVDTEGWSGGSPMAFLVLPAGGDGFRRAHSFDGAEDLAPVLRLTFEASGESASIWLGEHTVSAIPYEQAGGEGAAGEARTVQLVLVSKTDAADTDDGPGGPAASSDAGPPADAADSAAGVEPAEDQQPRESSDAIRRARYPLAPVGGGTVRGSVLLSAYDEDTSVLSVTLDEAPVEPVRVELWQGDCERRTELLTELAPYRPGIGSVTPLEVRFSTLQLANFTVLITAEPSGDAVACAELESAS